jgi:hypothetical protein
MALKEISPKLVARVIINQAKRQVVLQVLFAFEENPRCQQLTALCCAGEYWQAWQFDRKHKPELPLSKVTETTYVPLDWNSNHTDVHSLFGDFMNTFNAEFIKTMHQSILNL